jgi:hypothetical protein
MLLRPKAQATSTARCWCLTTYSMGSSLNSGEKRRLVCLRWVITQLPQFSVVTLTGYRGVRNY